MTIQYIEPLSQGISRMKKALFNPCDLKVWFTVGFTAFLAGLANMGFPSGSGFRSHSKFELEKVLYFPQRALEWLTNHPGWATVIAVAVFVLFILGIVLNWLSSRAKFMFLDNVVWNRARVVAPWYEYRNEGNSFFLWTFVWGLLLFTLVIVYVFYVFMYLQTLYESTSNGRALIMPAILAGLAFFFISIINLFIFTLLKDFVVPIMYRDRITTWRAIQKFFPTFMSHFFHFIVYELFILCLGVLIIIGIIIAGCVTCCIGFLILAIPYINAVVLLPISYAMRAFAVEFLEQFGPEYQVFPNPDIIPPAPQQAAV
jgi:hypothetical protein